MVAEEAGVLCFPALLYLTRADDYLLAWEFVTEETEICGTKI